MQPALKHAVRKLARVAAPASPVLHTVTSTPNSAHRCQRQRPPCRCAHVPNQDSSRLLQPRAFLINPTYSNRCFKTNQRPVNTGPAPRPACTGSAGRAPCGSPGRRCRSTCSGAGRAAWPSRWGARMDTASSLRARAAAAQLPMHWQPMRKSHDRYGTARQDQHKVGASQSKGAGQHEGAGHHKAAARWTTHCRALSGTRSHRAGGSWGSASPVHRCLPVSRQATVPEHTAKFSRVRAASGFSALPSRNSKNSAPWLESDPVRDVQSQL